MREKSNSELPYEHRILFVDNSIDNRLFMKAFASLARVKIDTSGNGREVLKLFQNKKYSLIFLGIHLSGMNGPEAQEELRRIESEKNLPPTPVIDLRESSFRNIKKKYHSFEFIDYVEKLFKKRGIRKILNKYIGKKDISYALKNIELIEAFKKLMINYLKGIRHDIKKIRDALQVRDFVHIKLIGHKIKGSGKTYGFEKLSELGQKIEKYAHQKNTKEIKHLINLTKNYLDNI